MTTTSTPDKSARPSSEHEKRQRFVADVMRLCRENKGAQADLRSGLGQPYTRSPRMHRHLLRLLPDGMPRDARQARYTVASLIAGRPRKTRDAEAETRAEAASEDVGTQDPAQTEKSEAALTSAAPDSRAAARASSRRDLGFSMAETVRLNGLKPGSAEGELHLLTRQSLDAILPRLPSLVRQLLNAEAPVEWAQLIADLSSWTYDRDRIATRWLENYYRTLYANEAKAKAAAADADAPDGPSLDETQ